MSAPSFDIKDMLEAESVLGLIFATNLFVGKEPSTPNNCVTVFDTGGESLAITGGGYDYPNVQIRVRNTDYEDGMNLAEDIADVLHGRGNNEVWNGKVYTAILCATRPELLDWDENNRVRIVINFNLQRR